MPPVANTVAEYAIPTIPPGSEVVVIFSELVVEMVMLSAFVADICGEDVSVTLTVKDEVPDAVGVPEMTPVLAASVKPAGRVPESMDQV